MDHELIERMIERFGPQLEAEAAADRRAAHTRAAEQLAATRARADKHAKDATRRLEVASAATVATRAAADRADCELATLRNDVASATLGFDQEIARLEAALRLAAPARLDAVITQLKTEQYRLISERPSLGTDGVPGTDRQAVVTNYRSVSARLEALRTAVAELEDLKLVVLGDRDLDKKIAAIMARLPDIVTETLAPAPAHVYQRQHIADVLAPRTAFDDGAAAAAASVRRVVSPAMPFDDAA